ncbi:MAG: hypothetical protein CMH12_10340 [Maritimibacter sp.]|nr:hypothetical protein [Maritimibacter sp.]
MIRKAALLLSLLAAAGCGSTPPVAEVTSAGQRETVGTSGVPEQTKIAALTQGILALSPAIDPAEAARIAEIAVEYPLYTLAPRYRAVDPPLVHNVKVNMGIKPRGLCKDWADDLEARLRQEGFQTVDFHRAIANADNIRIEHSTVIVSAKGAAWNQGIVLDPWREGQGVLYWAPVLEDDHYTWIERSEVFRMKREWAAAKAR